MFKHFLTFWLRVDYMNSLLGFCTLYNGKLYIILKCWNSNPITVAKPVMLWLCMLCNWNHMNNLRTEYEMCNTYFSIDLSILSSYGYLNNLFDNDPSLSRFRLERFELANLVCSYCLTCFRTVIGALACKLAFCNSKPNSNVSTNDPITSKLANRIMMDDWSSISELDQCWLNCSNDWVISFPPSLEVVVYPWLGIYVRSM